MLEEDTCQDFCRKLRVFTECPRCSVWAPDLGAILRGEFAEISSHRYAPQLLPSHDVLDE